MVINQESNAALKSETYKPFALLLRRGIAFWIDIAFLFLILLFSQNIFGNELYKKILPVCLFILTIYFPVLEGRFGYTVGKYLLRIKVVNINFLPPGIIAGLIRSVAKIIEVNPLFFGGLPAAIIYYTSNKKQRLGDMAAHTYVVLSSDIPSTNSNLFTSKEEPASLQLISAIITTATSYLILILNMYLSEQSLLLIIFMIYGISVYHIFAYGVIYFLILWIKKIKVPILSWLIGSSLILIVLLYGTINISLKLK